MRKQKTVVDMLRELASLISEEAERNVEFAARLEGLLNELPERRQRKKAGLAAPLIEESLPDIYHELKERGEIDFRLWLREQPVRTLRAVIRKQDFDATHRTAKWKDAEKLSDLIFEGIRARLARGSALGRVGAQ